MILETGSRIGGSTTELVAGTSMETARMTLQLVKRARAVVLSLHERLAALRLSSAGMPATQYVGQNWVIVAPLFGRSIGTASSALPATLGAMAAILVVSAGTLEGY